MKKAKFNVNIFKKYSGKSCLQPGSNISKKFLLIVRQKPKLSLAEEIPIYSVASDGESHNYSFNQSRQGGQTSPPDFQNSSKKLFHLNS